MTPGPGARLGGRRCYPSPERTLTHGGTRSQGAAHCTESEILIFLTQDAIPAQPCALPRLAAAFDNPEVGIAYGRQLPRAEAGAIESHARLYNYPPQSELRTLADSQRLGLKTCFCSNSFAAYRRSALPRRWQLPRQGLLCRGPDRGWSAATDWSQPCLCGGSGSYP